MANEVVIEEYADFTCKYEDGSYVPVAGRFITSQVLDVGTRSAKLDERTKMVVLCQNGTTALGFWYKIGDENVSAQANTNGNRLMPNGLTIWQLAVNSQDGETHIDTAALA